MTDCKSNETIYIRTDVEKEKDDEDERRNKIFLFFFCLNYPYIT